MATKVFGQRPVPKRDATLPSAPSGSNAYDRHEREMAAYNFGDRGKGQREPADEKRIGDARRAGYGPENGR